MTMLDDRNQMLLATIRELAKKNKEIDRLCKERDTWDRRVAYDELKAREYENRATQQRQIDRMTIDIERLHAALNRLVTTLTAVENSPSFQGIWPYLHAHGYKYQGPDWRDALADSRLALAADGQCAGKD